MKNWCSQCGIGLTESVPHCADHGFVCCMCDCKCASAFAEDITDLVFVTRGRWACPDCYELVRKRTSQMRLRSKVYGIQTGLPPRLWRYASVRMQVGDIVELVRVVDAQTWVVRTKDGAQAPVHPEQLDMEAA